MNKYIETGGKPLRCSIITLVGETNAGKSTLLNMLVGSKIAIVTPKVQTTRTTLKGIAMEGNSQLVFVDTPGIFKPKRKLEKAMVRAAWGGMEEADTLLLLIDAKRGFTPQLQQILDGIKKRCEGGHMRAVAALNKIDTVAPEMLLPLAARLGETKIGETGLFEKIFMISASSGDGVDDIRTFFAETAPEGPWLFGEDDITDAPMRFIASEITREKLFLNLRQELPYSLTVETEKWEERPASKPEPTGSVKVHQVILVEKEGHKKIILGASGENIRKIGEEARKELERLLVKRVHLFLFVKVRENWQDESERFSAQGLEYPGT